MFCHNCGTKLDDGSLFCSECGARQLNTPIQDSAADSAAAAPPEYAAVTGEARPEDPDTENQSKKDNRLILIIIIVIVLGIIAGVGMFFFTGRSSSQGKIDSDTQTSQSVTDSNKKPDAQDAKAKEEDKTEDADAASDAKSDGKKAASDKEESGKDNKNKDEDVKDDDKDNKNEDKKTGDKDEDKDKVYTHEYTVIQGMQTWADAKAYCEAQGGHLATAVSQAEYDQIVAKANATGCLVLWLGAQRSSDTGAFEWVTDEEFTYNAWAAGEPNNDGGIENYLGMMKVNGVWNMYDMPGDVSQYYSYNKVGFVLEKDIEQ